MYNFYSNVKRFCILGSRSESNVAVSISVDSWEAPRGLFGRAPLTSRKRLARETRKSWAQTRARQLIFP